MTTPDHTADYGNPKLGRRRLVAGAAWTPPAVLAVHEAPSSAASPTCPTNTGFVGLWDAATGKLSILLNNNGAKPVPAGGLLYATVKSEVGHTVTLSTTGQFAVDVSQAPTFNPGPTATFRRQAETCAGCSPRRRRSPPTATRR